MGCFSQGAVNVKENDNKETIEVLKENNHKKIIVKDNSKNENKGIKDKLNNINNINDNNEEIHVKSTAIKIMEQNKNENNKNLIIKENKEIKEKKSEENIINNNSIENQEEPIIKKVVKLKESIIAENIDENDKDGNKENNEENLIQKSNGEIDFNKLKSPHGDDLEDNKLQIK